MNDYRNFKCLLEYFVSHLEWVVNKDKTHSGYNTYIANIQNFKKAGQGYNKASIQEQIKPWCNYNNDCIHINIDARGYTTNRCYLNWNCTWINVRPKWQTVDSIPHIVELFLTQEEGSDAKCEKSHTLLELGLFNPAEPNECLISFFNYYQHMLEKQKQNNTIATYINLLSSNHNLILTGAPGTGKTYLAKLIAKELGATEENHQCMMVQFHPSYDYTDFVEGLRPKHKEGDANIGFELKRGSFKEFCAQALENFIDSKKSRQDINADTMFRIAYDDMIDKVRNGELSEIPLKSTSTSMEIEDVSDNNNLILKTKGSDTGKTYTVSYNRLRKLSLVYKDIEALDSISNIYKAVTDAIKGCHSSAYWATLYFLYKNHVQQNITEEKSVECKNFVFIIDEINRGEISKIFGELFFSIDPSYRGESGKVQTQYQNLIENGDIYEDGFYIPENVFIIGTMNDIDRSVDSMDFAMRRRFAWKEIKATDRIEMLDDLNEFKDKAIKRMINLNNVIEKTEGLNSSYHIGPAYFKKVTQYKDSPSTMWSDLWEYHIKGVLYEYVRGSEDVDKKMAAFETAYNNEQ